MASLSLTDVDPKVQGYLKRAADTSDALFVSDSRLALTDDGSVVPADDDSAAFLLVAQGASIPQSLATDLGIKNGRKKTAPDPFPAPDDSGIGTVGVRIVPEVAPTSVAPPVAGVTPAPDAALSGSAS